MKTLYHYFLITAISLLGTGGFTHAQTISVDVNADQKKYTGSLPTASGIIFNNRRSTYKPELLTYGFHFHNGIDTLTTDIKLRNNGQGSDFRASPVLGVQDNAKLFVKSKFLSAANESKPSIVLMNKGHIYFMAESEIDLILDGSYFIQNAN